MATATQMLISTDLDLVNKSHMTMPQQFSTLMLLSIPHPTKLPGKFLYTLGQVEVRNIFPIKMLDAVTIVTHSIYIKVCTVNISLLL